VKLNLIISNPHHTLESVFIKKRDFVGWNG
jgi:hypothetical protein